MSDDLICSGCGEYIGSHISDLIEAQAAEIARLREALERIEAAPAWGAPDRWEPTPSEVRQLARAALGGNDE